MDEKSLIEYSGEGGIRLAVKRDGETVWLTQAQMCQLFGRDVSVVSRHIRKIFKEGELDPKSNLHFLQIANSDKKVAFYDLDVVISVGYRVKSIEGTRFRQWATRKLREIMMAQLADTRRIDKLETRVSDVEQGLSDLAAEFNDWTIYPAHKPMGFGAEKKGR